jgi:hypothetical protein
MMLAPVITEDRWKETTKAHGKHLYAWIFLRLLNQALAISVYDQLEPLPPAP